MEENLSNDVQNMTIAKNSNTSDWMESGDSPKNVENATNNIPENILTPEKSSRMKEAHQNQLRHTSSQLQMEHSAPERYPRHRCQHKSRGGVPPQHTIPHNMNPSYFQNDVANPSGQTKIVRDEESFDEPHFANCNRNVTAHKCPNTDGRTNARDTQKVHEFSPSFVCNKHVDHSNNGDNAFQRDVSNNFMKPDRINRPHLCQHHLSQAKEQEDKDFNNNKLPENNAYSQNDQLQSTSNEYISPVNLQREKDDVCLNEEKQGFPCRNVRVKVSKSLLDLEPSQPAELKCVRKKIFREGMRDHEESKKEHTKDSVKVKNVKFEEDFVEMGYPPLKRDVEASRSADVSEISASSTSLKQYQEKPPPSFVVQRRNGLG